jgi:hypothetical protein
MFDSDSDEVETFFRFDKSNIAKGCDVVTVFISPRLQQYPVPPRPYLYTS